MVERNMNMTGTYYKPSGEYYLHRAEDKHGIHKIDSDDNVITYKMITEAIKGLELLFGKIEYTISVKGWFQDDKKKIDAYLRDYYEVEFLPRNKLHIKKYNETYRYNEIEHFDECTIGDYHQEAWTCYGNMIDDVMIKFNQVKEG